MKWNNKKEIQKCLNQSLETYTDLLSEFDYIDEDQMDEYEQELIEKINSENFEEEWINSQDLHATALHDQTYENLENELFCGCIVVLKCTSVENKNLILDGNHRFNTLKEKGINIPVFVIYINAFIPR